MKKFKHTWEKAYFICNFFIKTLFKDPNEVHVKSWFRQYFYDNDLHEGVWQLHYIDVKTTDKIIVTIVLGRPGLLIGKSGSTIGEIKNRLTDWLGKQVEIKIVEHNALN